MVICMWPYLFAAIRLINVLTFYDYKGLSNESKLNPSYLSFNKYAYFYYIKFLPIIPIIAYVTL